jgi:hypothetical protein
MPATFASFLARPRLQRVFSGVKQNVGHADDEPACAIASLENSIQLLGQSRAHGGFVGLRLLRAPLCLLRS